MVLPFMLMIGLAGAATMAAGYAYHKSRKKKEFFLEGGNGYERRGLRRGEGEFRWRDPDEDDYSEACDVFFSGSCNKECEYGPSEECEDCVDACEGQSPPPYFHKPRHDRPIFEYEEEYDPYFDPRPPPMSRRNPNDVSLFDSDIEEYGNYAMRGRMLKYAKHKMNSRYGFQASIWDLEPFLK